MIKKRSTYPVQFPNLTSLMEYIQEQSIKSWVLHIRETSCLEPALYDPIHPARFNVTSLKQKIRITEKIIKAIYTQIDLAYFVNTIAPYLIAMYVPHDNRYREISEKFPVELRTARVKSLHSSLKLLCKKKLSREDISLSRKTVNDLSNLLMDINASFEASVRASISDSVFRYFSMKIINSAKSILPKGKRLATINKWAFEIPEKREKYEQAPLEPQEFSICLTLQILKLFNIKDNITYSILSTTLKKPEATKEQEKKRGLYEIPSALIVESKAHEKHIAEHTNPYDYLLTEKDQERINQAVFQWIKKSPSHVQEHANKLRLIYINKVLSIAKSKRFLVARGRTPQNLLSLALQDDLVQELKAIKLRLSN